MIIRAAHLLIALFLLTVPAADALYARADTSVGRALLLEDYGRVVIPESPQISPHGKHIAFVIDERIHVVAADTEEPRALTSSESAAWEPCWSSDGTHLYFLSDRTDSNQVWMLPVDDYGEAIQLTDFEPGILSINFSPDESRLLLALGDDDLKREADDAEPQPIVVTRRQFKEDAGDGYLTPGESSHLYVYDITEKSLSQVTSGEFEEDEPAWSPDGRSIVFVSNRSDPDATYSNDLWLVALDSTDSDRTLTRLTNNAATKQAPAWSPAGAMIAYITAVDGVYGQQRLAVVPATGGDPKVLTAGLDRWVSSFEFSEDGDSLYFNYDDGGTTALARVRIRDGKIEKLSDGERVVSSFDLGRGGNAVILANNRNDTPDIYRLGGKQLSRLTDLNRDFFREIELGMKSKVTFESGDGTVVEAFVTTPPDYEPGRVYPAILRIHGGPVWQFSWGFDFTSQYFASRGYVVVEPNPRGSTGRGQQYINAIYRGWGMADYEDVIAAVDFAVEQGIADPDRLAVTGYSYGGYMTNVIITRTNRFKAAASGASESLIAANFGHDIYQKWFMWEFGPPWENREIYDALSPILRVENVETPTIFLGGRVDWNMPILNSEAFYQALRIRGVDTQLVVYPDTHHGDWSEAFDKDYIRRIVDWFDKYLASE